MTHDLNNYVPLTEMGKVIDGPAVIACLNSGMIVIVEVDKDRVAGIVSAHTNVAQAFAAYELVDTDESYAVIIPSETGPRMFYSWMTEAEFFAATRG